MVVLGSVLEPVFEGEALSGVILIFGTIVIGATLGFAPAVLSALVSAAMFNLLVAAPHFSFRFSSVGDLAPLLIFTLCALISGHLCTNLRDISCQLRKSNLHLLGILEASALLQAAPDAVRIEEGVRRTVNKLFGCNFTLLLPVEIDFPSPGAGATNSARVCLSQQTLTANPFVHIGTQIAYRLDGSKGCVGVMVIDNFDERKIETEFLEILATLVAQALDRVQLRSAITNAEASSRTEELKSALLASVSHDLRSPVTTISAAASGLIEFEDQLDRKKSRDLLESIVDECDRLNRFTTNLLDMSRLEAGQKALNSEDLSLTEVVFSVVHTLQRHNKSHEIKVKRSQEGDWAVRADPTLLEHALTNIVENAVKYSDEGSTIEIDIERHRSECLVTVTDYGCGIEPEDQLHIFERFFRSERRHGAASGSGLGLSIVKGFVEAFGGTVEVKSPVCDGYGTSVTIRLPSFSLLKVAA